MQEREAAANTPPPAQAQTKQEISNANLLRNPSKVIVLRVSVSVICMLFIRDHMYMLYVVIFGLFLSLCLCCLVVRKDVRPVDMA